MIYTQNLNKFLSDALKDLIEHKVNISFEYKNKVTLNDNDPDPSEAIFAENPLTVKIATKCDFESWVKAFIHEYCHFLQKKSKYSYLKYFDNVQNRLDANSIISQWLNGKQFNKKLIKKCINVVKHVELDCEMRVVELIRKYKLEIDIKKYIQMANCYIFFYDVVLLVRKWYKIDPCLIKEAVELMPDYFLDNYMHVDEKFSNIIMKKCF